MNQVTSQLSNRDIALLIWLGALLLGVLIYHPTRESLCSILKLLVVSKLGIGLLALLAYEALVVFIFSKVHLWHWWMLKDTLFWLFGTAVILFLNTTKATEGKHYFRKIALDNFKFAVALGFIINLYVFNLVTELILVPVLAFLAMLGAVAASKRQYKSVDKFINRVMAAIGITFIAYAVAGIATNFHGFTTLKNLEDFLVPIVLTLTLLPLAYLLGLYSAYESLFVRVDMRIGSDKKLTRYTKWQIMSACRFRLSNVARFDKEFLHKIGPMDSRAAITDTIDGFRVSLPTGEHEQAQRVSS